MARHDGGLGEPTETSVTANELNFANDAFAFVEAVEKADTPQALLDEMQDALGRFGFENFVITSLPQPGQTIRETILIHRLPDRWVELYNRSNFAQHDPVIKHCRRTVTPFEWDEAPFDPARNPEAAVVMDKARAFRMERGFCLPVHGLDGFDACISMSGKDVDLNPRTKPAIHLMALYAFERGRQISRRAARNTVSLSPRELEVLELSAQGLSAAGIAAHLGITERTVTAHVVNACQKLNASNKTQAVARAVHLRYVTV